MLGRLREWRIDRMTDRVARRPYGRRARAAYGADDVHSFAWEPVLDALELTPDDVLLDVGCGGGVFLRRSARNGVSRDRSRPQPRHGSPRAQDDRRRRPDRARRS